MSWRNGKRRGKMPSRQHITVTLQTTLGTGSIELIAQNGMWLARAANLKIECSHRTQEGVLAAMKTAIEERAAGQFSLPLIGGGH